MPELVYASFMVRLWRDPAVTAGPEQEPVWLGELESIQTGCTWQFQDLEPLLALLATQIHAQSLSSHSMEESS